MTHTPSPSANPFLFHLALYFIATIVLVIVNLRLMPDDLVVVWPLLAWGVVLALHAAYVMGLLPGRRR
jgi:2TM domain